jgi:hypothetical protein
VGYSTSGGFIDDIVPQLEEFKQAIVGGSIVVPETTERGGGEDVSAALVFDIGGRGDQSFNDSAAAGLDRAAELLGVNTSEASPNPDGSNRGDLPPVRGLGHIRDLAPAARPTQPNRGRSPGVA